jgi:hypothetical protein
MLGGLLVSPRLRPLLCVPADPGETGEQGPNAIVEWFIERGLRRDHHIRAIVRTSRGTWPGSGALFGEDGLEFGDGHFSRAGEPGTHGIEDRPLEVQVDSLLRGGRRNRQRVR